MAITYEKIAAITLTGPNTEMVFTSIPQTFNELVVLTMNRTDRTGGWSDFSIQFNGVTSGYSGRRVYATGANTFGTDGATWANGMSAVNTSPFMSNTYIYIPNYTSSAVKAWSVDQTMTDNNSSNMVNTLFAGHWNNTAAITSVRIFSAAGDSFIANTNAVLYGIKRA